MKKPLHHVTDHAVFRYLERVEGQDVEAVRRRIGALVDGVVGDAKGASAVISCGYRYVIRYDAQGHPTVTTVLSAEMSPFDPDGKRRRR